MTLRIPLQKIIKSQRKKSREDQKKKQLQNYRKPQISLQISPNRHSRIDKANLGQQNKNKKATTITLVKRYSLKTQKLKWEDLQDGRGVQPGYQLSPHKYIKNTPTCGTTPIENILNAGRRPQTSQKARNFPCTRPRG